MMTEHKHDDAHGASHSDAELGRETFSDWLKKPGNECLSPIELAARAWENSMLIEREACAKVCEAGAAECGKLLAEQDSEYNRKTNAMITRHSNQLAAERAVSDKLEKALKTVLSNVILGHRWHDMVVDALAEVEAMRKENEV